MRPQPPGLPDEKIDMVQNFLDTLPNAMNFEHIDGFFCALISGPEPVPFSEFMPYIFGGSMPKFDTPQQAAEITDALAVHWKHIVDSLNKGATYYPFLYADKDDKCAANDWADAFMLGVQLREAAWSDLLNEQSEDPLLVQIVKLRDEIADIREGKGHTIPSDEREEMLKGIVLKVQAIFNRNIGKQDESESAPKHN